MNLKKISKIKAFIEFRLTNKAIDMGMMNGQSRYRKFVILGRARTGSNYLRGMLNSHGHVFLFGELFRNDDIIDWSLPCYNSKSKNLLKKLRDDPVLLLKQKVFRPYLNSISAVGFKIFYYHAQKKNAHDVWNYLLDQKIHIIHIKRTNVLKTFLSTKKALLTGQWINTRRKNTDSSTLTLNYSDCLEFFLSTRRQEEQYDTLFRNNPMLEVRYENICNNPEGQLAHVQNFLGLEHRILKPVTHKQENKSMSQVISNYYILKKQFSGSPWQEFFDD